MAALNLLIFLVCIVLLFPESSFPLRVDLNAAWEALSQSKVAVSMSGSLCQPNDCFNVGEGFIMVWKKKRVL